MESTLKSSSSLVSSAQEVKLGLNLIPLQTPKCCLMLPCHLLVACKLTFLSKKAKLIFYWFGTVFLKKPKPRFRFFGGLCTPQKGNA